MDAIYETAKNYRQIADDYSRLVKLVTAFRLHPDWMAAFEKVWEIRSDLLITLEDGRQALPDINVAMVMELADQKFIETILLNNPISPDK